MGRELVSFRDSPDRRPGATGQTGARRRAVPAGLKTKLQRMDILTVAGLKGAVQEAGDLLGRIARPSTATDLLTCQRA